MKARPAEIIRKDLNNSCILLLRFNINEPHTGKSKNPELIEEQIRANFGDSFRLVYDEFGKPHLTGGQGFVSLSYCKNWIAIAFSETHEQGVDIEQERQQLWKIAPRFLNKSEQAELQCSASQQDYLQLVWGAKEALYKVYGRKKLIFNKNLSVSGLHPAIAETFTGEILTEAGSRKFRICWLKPESGTYLVYVDKELITLPV
ncbi:MAG: 4'-phosphopantetheinyl transferase superfamily protein [Bacteroidia bacterium]